MKKVAESKKEILSPDAKEVVTILEALDERSIVLARTYMTALSDRQKLEEAKLATVAV